jgi:HD-like signal output (HDOD) protein
VIYLFIGVFVVIAGGGLYFFLNKTNKAKIRGGNTPDSGVPSHPAQASPPPLATPAAAQPQPVARRAWRPIPAVLREFRFVRQSELESEKIRELTARLRTLPRPPSALHKLVSADFLSQATSAELSEIVLGEPEVAAKVLAIANSPLYGLQQLVGNIDQAVKFLGMNTVRSICLQYMLSDSIPAGSAAIKKVYARLWNESALACELCFKLAQRLKLDEPGTFVTQIVLACLGRQATYSLMNPEDVLAVASKGLLERSRLEQQHLGLASAELGALLMEDWALPKNIINIVKEIDATLVAPVAETSTSRRTRNALCYLCCRIAEDLLGGGLADLETVDILELDAAEYFHLHAYLELPSLVRTAEFIRSPDLALPIRRMVEAMRLAERG